MIRTDKLQLGAVTMPAVDISHLISPTTETSTMSFFDKLISGATKIGTAAGTVTQAFKPQTSLAPTTPVYQGGYPSGQTPQQASGPNYVKYGLIALGVAVAGYVGYKALN